MNHAPQSISLLLQIIAANNDQIHQPNETKRFQVRRRRHMVKASAELTLLASPKKLQKQITQFVLSDLIIEDRDFLIKSLSKLGDIGVYTQDLIDFIKFIDQQLKEDEDIQEELRLLERAVRGLMASNNKIALDALRAHVNRLSTRCPEVRDKFYCLTFPISPKTEGFG